MGVGSDPQKPGTASLTVIVKDERGLACKASRFTVTVMPKPVAPMLGELKPISLEEGAEALTIDLPLTVQAPTVSLAGVDLTNTVDPRGMLSVRARFTGNAWQLILTPHQAGSATVTLTATDERGLAGRPSSFKVNVFPRPVAPVLGELRSLPALEEGGQPAVVDLSVTVQTPFVSLAKATITPTVEPPGILTASANYSGGRWQLNLAPQKAGSATVTLKATDERGLSGNPLRFTLDIQRGPVVLANIAKLEQLAVQFRVLNSKDATSAEARSQKPFDHELTIPERSYYLQTLKELRAFFREQSPNPKITFPALEKKIQNAQ